MVGSYNDLEEVIKSKKNSGCGNVEEYLEIMRCLFYFLSLFLLLW